MTARRPYIPLRIKLEAALLQLGLDPETAELDHEPALALRERSGGQYIPDANDPLFLRWRDWQDHARKTYGRGGEKRITTAGSDIGNIAKGKRLAKEEVEFRKRLQATLVQSPKPKRRIPSRPFPKRRKP